MGTLNITQNSFWNVNIFIWLYSIQNTVGVSNGEGPFSGKLTFVHTSYLGTPILETDQKGDIVYIALTDINGNTILRDERSDGTLQNKIYTGHRYDNVTGLTYAHARYLDTRSHTFTTVDPLYYQLSSAQLYNPQLMNAYSYANNNPVSNTDPTGLLPSISSMYNSFVSSAKQVYNSAKTSINNFASNVKANVVGVVNVVVPKINSALTKANNYLAGPSQQATNFNINVANGVTSGLIDLGNATLWHGNNAVSSAYSSFTGNSCSQCANNNQTILNSPSQLIDSKNAGGGYVGIAGTAIGTGIALMSGGGEVKGGLNISLKSLDVVPSASLKLEKLSSQFDSSVSEMMEYMQANGAIYRDTVSNNVNIFAQKFGGREGYFRITLDPNMERVISAGQNKVSNVLNGLAKARFIKMN